MSMHGESIRYTCIYIQKIGLVIEYTVSWLLKSTLVVFNVTRALLKCVYL